MNESVAGFAYYKNPFSPGNLHGPNKALWRADHEHGGLTIEAMEAETLELVRRANALPDTEAQLAEAIRILAELRACHNLNLPAKAIRKYGEAADAFLAKVDAP